MKRFFIWKDQNCNGINPEWEEIDGKAFIELKKQNPERRFIVNFDEDEPEDDIFYYEATKDAYNEWNRDHMNYIRHSDYFKREYETVSLNDYINQCEEDKITIEETIPDTSEENAADEIENEKQIEMLKEALKTLEPKEMEVINILFLENPTHKSERQIARELGIPQKTLNNRKRKIFEKIKNFFGSK